MGSFTVFYAMIESDDHWESANLQDRLRQAHKEVNIENPPTQIAEYKATDNKQPKWLKVYEYKNNTDSSPEPSSAQTDILSQSTTSATLYNLVSSRQSPGIKLGLFQQDNIELVAVRMTLKNIEDAEVHFDRWYEEEHIDLLSKVPGWLRTRRFKTLNITMEDEVIYLALHEYRSDNGLGGEAHHAAMSTSLRDEVLNTYVKDKARRTYRLCDNLKSA